MMTVQIPTGRTWLNAEAFRKTKTCHLVVQPKLPTMVLANYMTNTGIIKNTSMDRVILKGFVNQRFFSDRLKLGLSVTNSHTINNNVPVSTVISESVFYLPTVSPFNPDGSYKEYYSRTGSGTLNPLSLINNNIIKTDDSKTLYNGIATLDIIKGLKYT